MYRVLIVDNEPGILSVLSTLLRAEGYEVVPTPRSDEALKMVRSEQEEFDLMIFDVHMSPVDGMELLRVSRSARPAVSVIMLTAYATVETAIAALKLGAFDYVTKPFQVDELLITVQRALEYCRALKENIDLKAQLGTRGQFESIVGESTAIRRVCEMIDRVATTDATVLIWGESGTGKELVAKAIHANSHRKDRKFVAVNCAALPETLLESEMFGHVKGAFTGASANKEGLFEVASGGTIFLDEIGAMPLSIQSKLLRVLQEREIRRVGGNDDIPVDTRVLAATNTRLEVLMKQGSFREDLYYRLSVIPIEIPPLRMRPEDILPLTYHILRREIPRGKDLPTFAPEVVEILMRYTWPGNVRELENAVKHATTFVRGNTISRDVLPPKILDAVALLPAAEEGGTLDISQHKSLRAYLREKEKNYVAKVLEHTNGDKIRAAEVLKISLATLYRKLPESYRQ